MDCINKFFFENQNAEVWFDSLFRKGVKDARFFTHLHTGISNTIGVEIWKNFRRAGGQVKLCRYNFSPCQTDRTSVAQLHASKISHQTD